MKIDLTKSEKKTVYGGGECICIKFQTDGKTLQSKTWLKKERGVVTDFAYCQRGCCGPYNSDAFIYEGSPGRC